MKNLLFLFAICCVLVAFSCNQSPSSPNSTSKTSSSSNDTVFFNREFKRVKRGWAEYYRLPPKKEGELYLFKDYYMSGDLQGEGYSSSKDTTIWEGTVSWYDHNGQLTQTCDFTHGVIDSLKIFDEGKIIGQANYLDGKLQGPAFLKPASGKSFEGSFKNGKKDGAWKVFDSSGNILESYGIREGKLHGKYLEEDKEYEEITEGEFENGNIIWYKHEFNLNRCRWKLEAKGKGETEYWKAYLNGNRFMEYQYINSKRTGEWKVYTMDGKQLFRSATFDPKCQKDELFYPRETEGYELPNPSYDFPDRFWERKTMSIDGYGCLHGIFTEYDSQGKVFAKIEYEHGKITGSPYLNKAEEVEIIPNPISCLCEDGGEPEPLAAALTRYDYDFLR